MRARSTKSRGPGSKWSKEKHVIKVNDAKGLFWKSSDCSGANHLDQIDYVIKRTIRHSHAEESPCAIRRSGRNSVIAIPQDDYISGLAWK